MPPRPSLCACPMHCTLLVLSSVSILEGFVKNLPRPPCRPAARTLQPKELPPISHFNAGGGVSTSRPAPGASSPLARTHSVSPRYVTTTATHPDVSPYSATCSGLERFPSEWWTSTDHRPHLGGYCWANLAYVPNKCTLKLQKIGDLILQKPSVSGMVRRGGRAEL